MLSPESDAMNPQSDEGFDVRRPQYMALPGSLGISNLYKASSSRGRRYLIQQKTVTV
jgi:hypothetical protein